MNRITLKKLLQIPCLLSIEYNQKLMLYDLFDEKLKRIFDVFDDLQNILSLEPEKLNDTMDLSLIRTVKCENIPISELKIAVIKASEVIISKLDLDDDKLAEVLSEVRLSLMKENQGNNGSFKLS